MTAFELATNAMKYGALSTDRGTISVVWSVATNAKGDPDLDFSWRESGGPAVHPPIRKGFGSALLENSIRMRHPPKLLFDPKGFVCQFVVALSTICHNEDDHALVKR